MLQSLGRSKSQSLELGMAPGAHEERGEGLRLPCCWWRLLCPMYLVPSAWRGDPSVSPMLDMGPAPGLGEERPRASVSPMISRAEAAGVGLSRTCSSR